MKKQGREQDKMIVLAGMIGAGKSSYTEMIARKLGTEAFYEEVDNNPILDKFYEDPKRWAFSLQIYFLNKRFRSIKQALFDANNVLDRSIYEDALFTRVNNMQGNISDVDLDIYNDLLENMMQEIDSLPKKAPDLLIYLDASFETILAHIKKRGRSYEQVDNDPELLEYYKLLYNEYQTWFDDYHYSPKIKISVDEYDIVEDPENEDRVMKIIEQALEDARKQA